MPFTQMMWIARASIYQAFSRCQPHAKLSSFCELSPLMLARVWSPPRWEQTWRSHGVHGSGFESKQLDSRGKWEARYLRRLWKIRHVLGYLGGWGSVGPRNGENLVAPNAGLFMSHLTEQ